MLKISCNKCHHSWEFEPPLGRGEECPKCRWDAHVCLNCKHYDKNFHHECRENQAEFVQVKDRSNFCDYFEPKTDHSALKEKDSAMQKLDQLFGRQNVPTATDTPTTQSLEDQLKAFLNSKKS